MSEGGRGEGVKKREGGLCRGIMPCTPLQAQYRRGSYNIQDSDSTASEEERIIHHDKEEEGVGPREHGNDEVSRHGHERFQVFTLLRFSFSLPPSLPFSV